MTTTWHPVRVSTGIERGTLDSEALLERLSRSLPYNLRWTLAGETLEARATVPALDGLVARREPWLHAVAAGDAGAVANDDAETSTESLETVRWLAAEKGWKVLDGDGPGLRLAVPGEHDLPPLAVTAHADGLRIERPLPLLPLRDAPAVVRAALAHVVMVLNGTADARIRVRDGAALTLAVETNLPAGTLDEDEAAAVLDEVCRVAPRAAGVLDCVRNPSVARVYAATHNLPESAPDREPSRKEE